MSLRHELENAFVAVVKNILGAQYRDPSVNDPKKIGVYRGQEFATKQAPFVLCHCRGGIEEPIGSRNRFCDVTVACCAFATEGAIGDGSDLDPQKQIADLSELVLVGLKVGDINVPSDPTSLAALLMVANPVLTVYWPIVETGYDPDLADFAFLDTMTFRIFCSSSLTSG